MEFDISQPKMVWLPQNEKQTYQLNYRWVMASNVTIGCSLGHDLDLEFSRSIMEFVISQPKLVRLSRNEKQTYWLNSRPQIWPSGLTLAMTLTLNFQGLNEEFAISQPKMVRCPQNKKQTYRLNCRPQMWPMFLTLAPCPWPWPLNFQGQMWPWPLTTCMSLSKDFHGQILK